MNDLKVLVTGHKGFIGKHVFDFLSDIFDVDGLDRPDDIENFVDVGCADYDIIIHLAAYAAPVSYTHLRAHET